MLDFRSFHGHTSLKMVHTYESHGPSRLFPFLADRRAGRPPMFFNYNKILTARQAGFPVRRPRPGVWPHRGFPVRPGPGSTGGPPFLPGPDMTRRLPHLRRGPRPPGPRAGISRARAAWISSSIFMTLSRL